MRRLERKAFQSREHIQHARQLLARVRRRAAELQEWAEAWKLLAAPA